MDLFVFVFLAGILAGLLIAALLLCAFYLFTRKREQRLANDVIEMQENGVVPLSSSITSIVESSAPIVLVGDDTGAEFSYVHLRANRLGFGRYGVVYKGTCVQDQSTVAIKLLNRQQYGNDKRAHKYFEREVATLKVGSMVSPNVVKLLGKATNRASLVIVTEYCDKGDMSRWMDDEFSRFSGWDREAHCLAIVIEAYIQLANGLIDLHRRRIAHRDLKGSNVLVTSRCARFVRGRFQWHYALTVPFTVKIGDFGLARFLDDPDDLTTGVGTERYMAPEVRHDSAYGTQCDLYSLGVMLKRDLEKSLGDEMTHLAGDYNAYFYQVFQSLTSADPKERASLESLVSAMTNFYMVTP